jgi:hypothetical protein
METSVMEECIADTFEAERPSEAFVKAVADLLETDATDILSELGYTYGQAMLNSEPVKQA